MARSGLVRHQLFVPRPLSEQLGALARGPGGSRSRILAGALAAFLSRKGVDELELRFIGRLDHLSNQLARIERNGHIELESLALFIRHMPTVNAPLADCGQAARAIERDRFAAFVERVGLALASGRLSLVSEGC